MEMKRAHRTGPPATRDHQRVQRERGLDSVARRVVLVPTETEERHDLIANELIDDTAVSADDMERTLLDLAQRSGDLLQLSLLGQRTISVEIREE